MSACNNNDHEAKSDSTTTGAYEALRFEYSSMASWYDSFWADYLTQTFRLPLKLLLAVLRDTKDKQQHSPSAPITVVDVACGTGEYVTRAQERLQQVDEDGENDMVDPPVVRWYGIEPCPEMLSLAKEKNGQTQWIQSAAEALPLEDASADVVCSTNAFHFFRDKPLALRQMHRVLRPGGQLIVTDWCADYFLVRLYHLVELLRWNFRFSHRYPGPLSSSTLQQLVEEAGFEEVSVETYTVCFWTVVVWGMQTVTAHKPC